MYLKTLKLAGFKSFADRTRIEFEPGVTVVVGPNGSGKSNIVDSISWVMGTLATKALRTQKMEDVIFAGTATRPAHGRAEVTLSFDNRERRLPLDLAEVAITRRLHADGTSEYEINGTPCRLLDIQELLSDSGVGRHQHVIVGQGQVTSILNASPADHRAVIEEAAGVLKHKLRREKASRRLERTEVDVRRLTDILGELKRQLRPLKRQAEAALRYEEVRARRRAVRLFVGGEELRALEGRLSESDRIERESTATRDRAAAALEEILTALPGLELAAGEAGRSLQRDTGAAARLETAAERLQRIAQVAHERRRSLEAGAEQAGDRRLDLESELREVTARLEETGEELRVARAEAEHHEIAVRALEDEERSLAEQETLPAEGVIATLRGDLHALESAGERDRRERESTLHRIEVVASRLEDEAKAAATLHEEIRAIDGEVAVAQAAYETARITRQKEQEAWDGAGLALEEARLDVAETGARVEALEHALAGPVDPAARALAESFQAVLGPLAARLDVPDRLAVAVDAALGDWSEAVVAADGWGLEAVVRGLKSDGLGGLPIVARGSGSVTARDVAAGLEALVDLLGPDADAGLSAALLGDVVVADDWSTAWEAVRRHPHVRAVTPDGDLVTAVGIRTARHGGASHVALESARTASEAARTGLARAGSLRASTQRSFDTARADERSALEGLEALETRLAGATEALARLDRSRAEGDAELARLEERSRLLAEASKHREERLGELQERLADLEGEEAARQAAWEALARRRQEIARRREEARKAREEAAGRLGAAEERTRLLEVRRRDIDEELARLARIVIDPEQAGRLGVIEDVARRGLEAVRGHIEVLRSRQRHLREAAGDAGHRLEEARLQRSDLERTLADAKDVLAGLAAEVAGLRVRREAVAEALRRDVDASEEQALTAPAPELPEGHDPAMILESLEAELRRMGPVNPLAAAEYAELSERSAFLEGQLADLDRSRRELVKVITALDDEMAALFSTAFDDISRLYEENFAVLFPGGRGRLRLTEPDEALETGVEIEAQPLGKKVNRLSLLSGGERSLAALAFLFAVFRARPSPFYILDEVEAALDDANLRRFLRLVDMLRDTSQVIIVTHQQQTMEAADILYGVTMEPGGSSQVIARRLVGVRT